ncbi:MAG: hypothetical protein ACKO0V_20185 [bacterium]
MLSRKSRLIQLFPGIFLSTRLLFTLLILYCQTIFSTTATAQNTYDPWLIYRSLGIDDLKLALSQTEQRLEILRLEVSRSDKLVRSGASPQAELIELSGDLQIKIAERDDLLGLIAWMEYLQRVSTLNTVPDETEYFQKLTGLLKPRVSHANAITSLFEKRYAMLTKLRERRAIAAEEFERSADEFGEAKIRQLLYQAQYLSAQYALEVRDGKRLYDDAAATALAQSVRDARIRLWERVLDSTDHRLKRLAAMKERGIASQAEIDSAISTQTTIQKALDDAKKAPVEPHPAPGQLKRPRNQNI